MRMNSDIWFGTSGPRDASIMLVGEAWGSEEATAKAPFIGMSGRELTRILDEARIPREACFVSNVIPARPQNNEMWHFFLPAKEQPKGSDLRGLHPGPEIRRSLINLQTQIAAVRPKLIIAAGNYALWALTNCTGYNGPKFENGFRRTPSGMEKWRGSMWYADALPPPLNEIPLLPIYHPASILRAWYNRAVTVHDLRARVPLALKNNWRPNPAPTILHKPTTKEISSLLNDWTSAAEQGPLRLAHDIETTRHTFMTCCVLAPSKDFALVIPFIRLLGPKQFESYWTPSEEHEIVARLRRLLTHPNVRIEGQNYLYDTQYCQAEWAITPRLDFDTMLAHHLLFPGTPKGLDYLSSLYCTHHWYWKDDNKEWDLRGAFDEHLLYNGADGVRTFEVATALRGLIVEMEQEDQWKWEMKKNRLALRMMNRGVRADRNRRAQLAADLALASENLAHWFLSIIPQEIVQPDAKTPWYRSSKQQRDFFSEGLGLRLPHNRKTGNETLNTEALKTLAERHPEYSRLFAALEDYRSIGVFYNTFVKADLDPDGRIRCMFNVAGTETFRWSSSTNAFGRGTNLQNIPAGDED